MNTRRIHRLSQSLVVGGSVLIAVTTLGVQTNSPVKSNKTTDSEKSDLVEVPRSTFTLPTKAGEGRDPFFPLSRRMVVEAAPAKNGETPKPAAVSLILKGISRTDTARFALINDKTFEVGEEREVVMNNSRVRVHCIEIKEDSVVVEINGARQELRLRPGL